MSGITGSTGSCNSVMSPAVMEFKTVVFSAARDGKLRRLKVFLDHRPREEVKLLVSAKTNGATPLVMAARNGHLEVAEYLIDKCHADIEQVGSVTFDGETIEGAPPLWCASAAGHLELVKLLIGKGACVNSTTKTNSTPLRAACYDGHLEIVRYLIEHGADVEIANRHGHTCLMIASYKGHVKIATFLIEFGANVNRKSVKGNTALHDCAESGSVEILKLLLEHGAAMDVDSYGMTPLLAAAVTGNAEIVNHLICLPSCSRKEKVDALELLGATHVDKKRDMPGALSCWKRALRERHSGGMQKPRRSCVAAYENSREVRTLQELEEVTCDPDQMRMQALLVRERILGPAHPDTSYYIRYRGAVYADTGNFERCIRLWLYALDMQQKMLEPLSPMTQSSLLSFAELFAFMMHDGRHIAFRDISAVFDRAVREVAMAADRSSTHFHRTLVIVMHLVGLMCRLQPHLPPDQDEHLRRSVYRFLRMGARGRSGWTPLHLACAKECSNLGRYPVCAFPSLPVVQLLLECGAPPDAVDLEHNTPLHVAAMNRPAALSVFKALLAHGAHLDACNLERRTPLQVAQGAALLVDVFPLRHLTLQCLCAQAIVRHGLPYKARVPRRLEPFIEMH